MRCASDSIFTKTENPHPDATRPTSPRGGKLHGCKHSCAGTNSVTFIDSRFLIDRLILNRASLSLTLDGQPPGRLESC
jgi:hypothetical protein